MSQQSSTSPNASAPMPDEGAPVSAAYLDAGEGPVYLVPGHRLTIGSSSGCDLVLKGPGISPRHARVYLRPDGQLSVRPLTHRHLRVGGGLVRRPTPFAPGVPISLGLHEVETGAAESHFYLHLVESWRHARRSFRTLRRGAKWGLFSATVHFLLFLMLLPWLLEREGLVGRPHLGPMRMEQDNPVEDAQDDETVTEEPSTAVTEPELPQLELSDPTPTPEPDSEPAKTRLGHIDVGLGERAPLGELDGADLLSRFSGDKKRTVPAAEEGKIAGQKIKSESFAKTVAKLRERGFEVVFAFDSTGSMSSTLSEAKAEMQRILDLLLAVAPDLRVGLVAYRDHNDEYLTRAMPLGSSRYETLAFLSSVTSGGGGDHPEAVDAALRVARRFRWRAGSIKAVVMIGDAPPHEGSATKRALSLANALRRRRGKVHFVATAGTRGTIEVFERIAKAGQGKVVRLSDTRQLAKTLLAAALGQEAEQDLESLLNSRSLRRPASAPPIPALLSSLRSQEPDADVIEGWRNADLPQIRELLARLPQVRCSKEGRMALVYLSNLWAERLGLGEMLWPEAMRKLAPGRPPDKMQRFLRLLDEKLPSARGR